MDTENTRENVDTSSSSTSSSTFSDEKVNKPSSSSPPPPPSHFDTLVLSGGSIKAIGTLGALQYCYDNYMLRNVRNYVATSAGAMISYLLIIGYTPVEIIVYICTHKLLERMQSFNIISMVNGEGALSFSPIQEELERMTIAKTGRLFNMRELYDHYHKKLVCVTYNRTKRCTEYLDHLNHPELPCLIALRMSSNLPFIFDKFRYEGCYYSDGAVCDTFPIDVGDDLGESVLGITLGHTEGEDRKEERSKNVLEEMYELMFIPISQIREYKASHASEKCKIVTLRYTDLKVFNFGLSPKEKLEIFSQGYSQMRGEFEK